MRWNLGKLLYRCKFASPPLRDFPFTLEIFSAILLVISIKVAETASLLHYHDTSSLSDVRATVLSRCINGTASRTILAPTFRCIRRWVNGTLLRLLSAPPNRGELIPTLRCVPALHRFKHPRTSVLSRNTGVRCLYASPLNVPFSVGVVPLCFYILQMYFVVRLSC